MAVDLGQPGAVEVVVCGDLLAPGDAVLLEVFNPGQEGALLAGCSAERVADGWAEGQLGNNSLHGHAQHGRQKAEHAEEVLFIGVKPDERCSLGAEAGAHQRHVEQLGWLVLRKAALNGQRGDAAEEVVTEDHDGRLDGADGFAHRTQGRINEAEKAVDDRGIAHDQGTKRLQVEGIFEELAQDLHLLGAMGREDLRNDPRFKTNADRVAHIDETDALVGTWTQTLSKMEVFTITKQHRIPCAPVRNVDEVMHDAHMHERGMLELIDHDEIGRIVVPTSPLRFHGADRVATTPSPKLAQHNADIYGGWLGLSPGEIADLKQSGVI